ncbi:MAG: AmmeMemoRadiSam system radical SAM enzyme [Planctomycetaceae bacterium]|nr:AmmeMemoRadiSam system radical SAM enzyme [Planctomycetaceae bacterium]
MTQIVLPPDSSPATDGSVSGGWWHSEGDRILCDLCPRRCSLKPGDRGFCFVRQNVGGDMRLTTYGRSTGFCIDPIEKKPLNHFHPGTPVLSFGTAGCNLGCSFCQNWDISKSREVERLSAVALPDAIARAAHETGCASVAYTYNDPIIWAEYAIDTARACRDRGIFSVAVTAGYIEPAARAPFFEYMDAANVDLKAFTEDFYQRITYSQLQPVLKTLKWLRHDSDVWFEITNLLIPDANDSPDELRQMCDWIVDAVGPDVPVHFTAFHPDFRMTDRPRTPHETLLAARAIALEQGLQYAYVGNVHDVRHQSTWCARCGELLIERDWHQLGRYEMQDDRCGHCAAKIPGRFDKAPGTWGRQRQPVDMSRYAGHNQPAPPAGPPLVPLRIPELQSPPPVNSPAPPQNVSMNTVATSPDLSTEQEDAIHQAASAIISQRALGQPISLSDPDLAGAASTLVMGAFTTIKRNGQLRGCCGSLGKPMPLVEALSQSASRTAAEDKRFPPVAPTELPFLSLDVTLLYNFEQVDVRGEERPTAIELGRHGIRIAQGNRAALFLPSVATEQGWDAVTFLNQLCRKAGLPATAWKDKATTLLRFEGHSIERTPRWDTSSQKRSLPWSTADAQQLARFAHGNILAQVQGAVPGCFPPSVSDGTVDGIALQASFAGSEAQATFSQLQVRGGFALQTTLLNLTQAAANWIRRTPGLTGDLSGLQVQLALFGGTSMHGTLATVDLAGFDSSTQSLLIKEGQKAAWRFDSAATAKDMLPLVAAACRVQQEQFAQVLAIDTVSSTSTFHNANVPQPVVGAAVRPPAVAGRFYPGAAGALKAIVKKCMGDVPTAKTAWPAAMVPHAGLQYSGPVAAGVLKQLQIPPTVVIICPKHTRAGIDWAVSPCETWQLPHGEMKTDLDFARRLVESVESLEFDAAAHAQEHAIEVLLPLLHHVAPAAKVVGIAMGGGSWKQCRVFGEQLALAMSEQDTPPLLLISSDMNHFADDASTRELDERALCAMETLNSQTLHDTVRDNNISMCGMLPAVVVMEALLNLDQLDQTQRCGYATSGDVTGDRSRVVGYAGMLLGPEELATASSPPS